MRPCAATSPHAVRIDHIEVRRDRIVAHVRVQSEGFVRTSPALIAALSPAYPHLLRHACVNEHGTTFAAVAAHTSTPHLLEHMAIENQVKAEDAACAENFGRAGNSAPVAGAALACAKDSTCDGSGTSLVLDGRVPSATPAAPASAPHHSAMPSRPMTYVGKTSWENRAERTARIELRYADDLTALAALRDAARDLNAALAAIAPNPGI